ncbi:MULTISPECIES: TolC family protein [Spirosoma]|uniref:TolC family protein n=1 Tax=Spirosoma liriopis TaxID=2937440 RepID=A0ABT0HR84_9BACT|nr:MULTISPECIES: TolC family protein [Spirosoma]MCK8494681.1 TolC family protein [Spirosoma liriopis]UHG93865.1 TolC family protein [Spirosoma oryzicola]
MLKRLIYRCLGVACMPLLITACKTPALVTKTENRSVPVSYNNSQDSTNTGKVKWRDFFTDPNLVALIDTAIRNNQELNITAQEIQIASNEIRARQGEYRPFVGLRGGAGVDKVGRYTLLGAAQANAEMKPGKEIPDPLPNYYAGLYANWEVDIWHKLRNAKKAAINRYLSSNEGRNFTITNIIAEIATSYYELLALDNQLAIVRQNIDIQNNALRIVRQQKEATRVTELAVRRFEAQVLNTQNLQYNILQRIVETENRINFLVGRYPQPVVRNSQNFNTLVPTTIQAGIPSQLLANRPDIRQAEQDLAAAKLDVKVAKARFYPSLGISAGIGYQAFNPAYILKTPESLLFSLAGDIAGPLINKNAIIATYYSANARQIQAVYNYERTILNAYIEVANQLSKISNLEKSYDVKSREVEALTQSINISNNLFNSARAEYSEVLFTQRDALESRFDLVETKMQQMTAMVNIYRALGGGWQ